MAKRLINNIENNLFLKFFDMYDETIALKASQKKKKSEEQELLDLDRWYQNELTEIIEARKETYINSEELVKIMKWKLLRGKWRPRLVEFAKSNLPKDVIDISGSAFRHIQNNSIEDAVEELCKLKGVGPATASAILTALAPTKTGFFADEIAEVFLEGKIKYTANEYLHINQELRAIAHKLNNKKCDEKWTPHKVEIVLWICNINEKYNPEVVNKLFDE